MNTVDQALTAPASLRRRPSGACVAGGVTTVALIAGVPSIVVSRVDSLALRSVAAFCLMLVVLAWQSYERNAPNRRPWTSSSTVAVWALSLSATSPMYSLICTRSTTGTMVASALCALCLAVFLVERWR